MPKVQRSIRLSPECDEALRVMAEQEGRSVSQLLDRMVRMQYIGQPGERSRDGRESARTKAARERGLISATEANLARQERLNKAKAGKR